MKTITVQFQNLIKLLVLSKKSNIDGIKKI